MSTILTEEQGMLNDSVRAFLTEQAPVAHLRELRARRDPLGYCPQLWRAFGTQGYSAILVPETHGGLGLGAVEAGLMAEQLGRSLAPSPFLSTAVLAPAVIARAGSAAQQARLLPAIAGARTVMALAIDESAKHRPDAIGLRAQRDGDGFRLDGHKCFVVDGHAADLLIVVARTSDEGLTFFLVERGTQGLSIERTFMADAHNAARLRLENVYVDASAVLGQVDAAAPTLEAVLDLGRALVAAQLLGAADEVFERTVAYLKERKQFGRIIGEFQALQHRAALMYVELELTRAAVRKALQAVDHEDAPAAALRVSSAKALACSTADLVVREGVQLHGGMGMTDELDIGLFMKRVRTLQELLGDANFHVGRVAALSGY